jgi:hypothetical protein
MKKPNRTSRESESHSTLLGDLETIRSLLEMPETTPITEDADDVPVLQDMVEGAFIVNESVLTSRSTFEDGATTGHNTSGLADDTIKVLLGDEWRAGARKILADARSAVEGAGGAWSAAQLNTLNESLKVRIDHTLDDWLVEMMNSRMDDLRGRLLTILETEIEQFTRALTDKEQHGK